MALQPFVGPWPLFQFLNIFYTVGKMPWMSDQSVARPLPTHRTTETQNKYTHIPALSGNRTHDSNVRASEDSSWLRPRGLCDGRRGSSVPLLLISALDGGESSAWRPCRFAPRETAHDTHCTGGWVGPTAGLDAMNKRITSCPCRESNLDSSAVLPITSTLINVLPSGETPYYY
jgi:hypothetical protein